MISNYVRNGLMAGVLAVMPVAGWAQAAPVTSAPVQTTTTTDAAAPASMSKDQLKAQKKQQKSNEKAAKDASNAAKAKEKALKAQDKATQAQEKSEASSKATAQPK